MWEAHEGRPLELFEKSEHDTGRLLQKYSNGWDACLKGGGRAKDGCGSSCL